MVEVFVGALAVGLLGGAGSVVRHLIGSWRGFLPWGILVANSLASFIAGLALSAGVNEVALIIGLAGGLSTFSTFAAQSYELWAKGRRGRALLNGVANLVFPAVSFLTASILL
ncbi:MAG: CrcB family protein [Rhodoluna sp.]